MSIIELRDKLKSLVEERNQLSVEAETKVAILNKEIEDIVCQIRQMELSVSSYRR